MFLRGSGDKTRELENKKKRYPPKTEEKLHGKCHPRDCDAKQEISKPLADYGVDMTAKEMFTHGSYSGSYNAFRSALSRYVKYGYIEKLGTKKPHLYHLTDYGYENCIRNPYGYREERVKINQEKMKEHKRNMYVKYDTGTVQVQGGGYSGDYSDDGGYGGNRQDFGNDYYGIVEPVKDEKNKDILENIDEDKLKRLEAGDIPIEKKEEVEIKEDEQQIPDVTPDKDAEYWKNMCYKLDSQYKTYIKQLYEEMERKGVKNPEKIMKEKIRIENRRALVEQYRDQYLDSYFFNQWGMYPVRVKGAKAWKKGDVEIMSKNNAEFSRGHIKHVLNEEQIYNSGFGIVKFVKNGIYVQDVLSKCMAESKLMKY